MITRRRFLSALALAGGSLSVGGCISLRATSSGPGWRGPVTDHFDGRHFFNPHGPTGNTFSNLLKWQRTKNAKPWPSRVENAPARPLPDRVRSGESFVTAINHCTFLLQLPGCTLLTDPVWSERVSPFGFVGPRRVRSPGVAWENLPHIDAVLVSHNHFDHLDLPTLRSLHERFRPKFITGLGNRALLEANGLTDVEELDWWQVSTASMLGARITYTPAQHWSARSFLARNTTLWGGFWIEGAAHRILFAGDSGYSSDFATIREKLGAPDLALMPIGAYDPRWFMAGSHMDPAGALQAHRDLGARRSLAMHFDTFQLADEGYGEAERELVIAREAAGLHAAVFHAPAAGETTALG